MSEYIIAHCVDSVSGVRYDERREEIVRCSDCKWLDHHNLYLCMLPDGDGGYACWVVEHDGYCALGERRNDERG